LKDRIDELENKLIEKVGEAKDAQLKQLKISKD